MNEKRIMERVAARYLLFKQAGPLTDVKKLRFQAVVVMGAGGSGKGYVSHKWLKYMPGGSSSGQTRKNWKNQFGKFLEDEERGLTNLNFEKAVANLNTRGIEIELIPGGARIPFRLYTYDAKGGKQLVPPKQWSTSLPPDIYKDVEGLTNVVFTTPVHSLPSYWREVNPDTYKEELLGYHEDQPGYVHQMSSTMSSAYLQAAVETGDPLFVDGTGKNLAKMAATIRTLKDANYKVSLVLVTVPLTVNQIRNATRPRNVDARLITNMWAVITRNFVSLRSQADKSQVVINRNDTVDKATYLNNEAKINRFILASYHGEYSSLADLIKVKAPSEYRQWAHQLGWR